MSYCQVTDKNNGLKNKEKNSFVRSFSCHCWPGRTGVGFKELMPMNK